MPLSVFHSDFYITVIIVNHHFPFHKEELRSKVFLIIKEFLISYAGSYDSTAEQTLLLYFWIFKFKSSHLDMDFTKSCLYNEIELELGKFDSQVSQQ